MNTDELEKYEGLIDAEGFIDYDGLDYLLTEVKRLQRQVISLLHSSLQRLERLQEHEISDPVWEAEHDTDEYTGESIE